MPGEIDALTTLLAGAGFIAAPEEAAELTAAAGGDRGRLDAMVRRRLTGEPLAWITGTVRFCDIDVRVDPGVYVPRPQSEELAWRAVRRLPETGVAIDLCTGSGAVAQVLARHRPQARVVAGDLDARAVACARTAGVKAHQGDLFDALPGSLRGAVDVVVAVVPYVPTDELPLLQRDTLSFESALSYDGGEHGTAILRRVILGAARFLRRGGALLLELGGEQAERLGPELGRAGYDRVEVLVDEDGDVRGIEATLEG